MAALVIRLRLPVLEIVHFDIRFVGMDRDDARQRIAEYIVLDAVISNTDRHHENWGVVVERVGDREFGRIAPSFDHASSLERERTDERRILLMDAHRVGQYSEKGRDAIYWLEDQRHGPSPQELARRVARKYPDIFQPALSKLDPVIGSALCGCVYRVPDDVMSAAARMFANELMRFNFKELRRPAR